MKWLLRQPLWTLLGVMLLAAVASGINGALVNSWVQHLNLVAYASDCGSTTGCVEGHTEFTFLVSVPWLLCTLSCVALWNRQKFVAARALSCLYSILGLIASFWLFAPSEPVEQWYAKALAVDSVPVVLCWIGLGLAGLLMRRRA